MVFKRLGVRVEPGDTEHISYSGKRVRKSTVLIRVGKRSLSRKAFILGASLILCQFFDGFLTYLGLQMLGVHMEGNTFLQELMHAYGTAPVLVVAKFLAVAFVVILTFYSHHRVWLRPIIGGLVVIYLALAVIPWTYIILKSNQAPVAVENR